MNFFRRVEPGAFTCEDCGATTAFVSEALVHAPHCPLMLALDKAAKAANYEAWSGGGRERPEWPWRLSDEQREALRVLDAAVTFLQGTEKLPRPAQVWVHGRLQDALHLTGDPYARATLEAMRQFVGSYLYPRR